MYAPILSEATKNLSLETSNWGLFLPRSLIECIFLTLLIIIQSNVVISMNVFDCNDSYHGFTFLVLHAIHFIDHAEMASGRNQKKKLKLSRSVSRFMKIEKICDNWIGCGERKPWWGLIWSNFKRKYENAFLKWTKMSIVHQFRLSYCKSELVVFGWMKIFLSLSLNWSLEGK